MQEIPSLFCRDYDKPYGARLVRGKVVPGSEGVLEGKGVPTVKWDVTASLRMPSSGSGMTASCRAPPLSILSRCRCCRRFTASPCTAS